MFFYIASVNSSLVLDNYNNLGSRVLVLFSTGCWMTQILWRIFGQSYDLLLQLLWGIEQDEFTQCGESIPL